MALPTRRHSTNIFRPFPELRWDPERLFDDIFGRPTFALTPAGPEADFYETEDEFVLEVDLPGFESGDVDVTVEQGVLSIGGQRTVAREEEKGTYHLRERSWGRFSRSFSVPTTIDANKVQANFERGVLTVTMPKAVEAKARKIEIGGK